MTGKISEVSPVGGIDVTLNFLSVEVAQELEQRLKQPGISAGLQLQESQQLNKVAVKCEHWVNVSQLERHTRAAATAIFEKNYNKTEKK